MCMYIETKQQYSQFEGDELTDLLGQMIFQINNLDYGKVIMIQKPVIFQMI